MLKKLLALALAFALLLCAAPLACAEEHVMRLWNDGSMEDIHNKEENMEILVNMSDLDLDFRQGPLKVRIESIFVAIVTVMDESALQNHGNAETYIPYLLARVAFSMENVGEEEIILTDDWAELITNWGEAVPFSFGAPHGEALPSNSLAVGASQSGVLLFRAYETWPEFVDFFTLVFARPEAQNGARYSAPVGFCVEIVSAEEAQTRSGVLSLFAEPEEYTYILNTHTKKFHLPTCDSVNQIQDENKQFFTGSREELTAAGYSPCGNCNP